MSITASAAELEPFRPGTDGPWDRGAAAHLLRRAGFGVVPGELARALAEGPATTVASLLAEPPDGPELSLIATAAERIGSLEALQGAWVHHLLHGPGRGREKLALFWHDHFATSAAKVEQPRLMWRQIGLFRRLGGGRFTELLAAVARDPAMLIWLDGVRNRRAHPNENFARELMELFALGIGHYSEHDVREAARAFTGWGVRDGRFHLAAAAHDGGEKTLFGRRGAFDGEAVIAACAAHPACAPFIAGKLFACYAGDTADAALRARLGAALRDHDGAVAPFLAWLWSTRLFLGPRLRRIKVASPAEYLLGAVRSLELRIGAQELVGALARAGQNLLRPPSVAGWPRGAAWLDSTALLARWLAADHLSRQAGRAESALDRIVRLFPEGLEQDPRRRLLAAAAGSQQLLTAGLLQLPEAQYC